jgi:VanZ family protein
MDRRFGGRQVDADLFSRLEQWLPPRRAQLLTICYVGIIYATLPVMRPILNFLKENLDEAFSSGVYVLLFVVALGIIVLFLTERRGWKSFVLLFGILGVTASILPSIKYPEERVHFLEYAVLGVMLYFALRERIKGRKVFIWIPIIVFFIGLGDEIIQGILPNRAYQFTDVVLNFCGGILGELILITFNPVLIKKEKNV